MMEKVLINKFIRGLNNLDLQKHVQFQRANTLDTAISYVIEYKAFINPQNNMRKPMLANNEAPIQAIKDNKKESSTSHTESLTLDQVAKLNDEKLSLKTETENRNGYYQNKPSRFNNRGRGSERIIEASKRDSFVDDIGIIEPLDWVKSKGLLVAKSLVDTENTIYLAIMNLNSKSVKLKQCEQIAHLMTIEQVFNEDNTESQIDSNSDDISEQVNTLKDIDMPVHLKSMLDKLSSDLKDEEKQKLSSLIHEYKDIFVGPDGFLGRTDRVKHYIDTSDAKPVKISTRRVALKQRDVLEEELKKMIDKNLIEPSCSPWLAPVCLVKKRDGFAGYYRHFIPDFTTIAHPLTQLTQKNKSFIWDDKCKIAFETLKEWSTTAPTLPFPSEDGAYILYTDASQTGVGALSSQIQNGEEHVIAYSSRTLNRAQKQYCTTKRELLAVIIFLCQFRHYLYGQKFTLRTDHASIKWLKNFKNPEGMIASWITIIDTYDMVIQHRKGSLHTNADGLSRTPKRKCKRINYPECTEMKTDIEYFENVKTTDCIDLLMT
ncbi:unnamed protein product [Mytilus coruscus]|uniref:Reverse transcriptase RNase H-like domain-containing protein n=1 Tax=Mytilus coruscus TaxID=42192 RepID=A0A6J8A9G0_MYTCO|nr:unnamed protein product [Mytilus coruscus]